MKTLEEQLREQERVSLPAEWREEIVGNALAKPSKTVFMTWLFPRPWRYGLAAAWAAIAVIHGMTPNNSSLHSPAVITAHAPNNHAQPPSLTWLTVHLLDDYIEEL